MEHQSMMIMANITFLMETILKTESIPKIDSALVFRVNYGDESAPIDAPQKEEEPAVEPTRRKSNSGFDFKSSLIMTGICATETTLSKGPTQTHSAFVASRKVLKE